MFKITTKSAAAAFAGLVISNAGQASAESSNSTASDACNELLAAFPTATYFANSTEYVTLNEDFFSAAEWLGPACVIAPASTADMAQTVSILVDSGVQFAIRGGGHMPIKGAANINSTGILIASSGLTQLQIADDLSTVSVGPGNKWGAVYEYLDPYGLTVVGARMGVVGVPGFLLGGGMSFFSNEYGWASANIARYECVLGDGTVVNATAFNEYSDLFWALRGGGNSFAIVTAFELNTIDAPEVTVGQANYGYGVRTEFLDSIYGFTTNGVLDTKAFITPTVNWLPSQNSEPYYTSMLFYNGNDTAPAALANFTGAAATDSGLNATTNTFAYRSMLSWSNETEDGFSQIHGMRFRFHVLSIQANRAAMDVIYDTILDLAAERLMNVTDVMITIAFNSIADSYIEGNRGASTSGDPMGISTDGSPYLWIEESIMYESAADDATIDAFLVEVNAAIAANLAAAGLDVTTPFIPLNNSDKDQPVFEGYNADNVVKMKAIRAKYDPESVYTNQMPGGFKVAAV